MLWECNLYETCCFLNISLVIVISKMFKFEKRLQYESQSFRPCAFFAGKYEAWRLQIKERINV